MADVMVVVSKAVFEKAYGKAPKLGTVLGIDRYVTANKALEPLRGGGKLYCVTVRPPDEQMWLVAILDNPQFDGEQWTAKASTVPITDISALRSKLKFESGKGITANPGALGMSLQTPRTLTAADAALIDALVPQVHTGEGFPAPPKIDPNTGERRQGDALIQAVIDEPDSDLARQVCADALQARNDPRGELIVLELALAGPLAIRKREVMKARRDALLAEHRVQWFPTQLEYRTRGGFISAITGSLGSITSEQDTLFANQPIVEAAITHVQGADKLLAAPWLARIRHLILRGELDAAAFAALVAASNTQQLVELNVTGCGLVKNALAGLKANLPECRTLVLTSNSLGDDGVARLVDWSHLAEVETLYLSSCNLGAAGLEKLLAANLPNLTKLTLAKNKLDGAIGRIFAKAAKRLPRLEHLELTGNAKLDASAVEELRGAKLPAIRRIDVRQTRIRKADVGTSPVFRTNP